MKKKAFCMKKILRATVCAILCLALLLPSVCAEAALRGYEKNAPKGQKYQYVTLGDYPYEADGTTQPVLWWILSVDSNEALLFSDIILDTQQVMYCDNEKDSNNHKFRRMNSFEESDLCAWMNSTMLDTLLGDDPMRGALVETKYGLIYPLTDDQMLTPAYGFSRARYDDVNGFPERRATGSPYAKNVKLFSWGKQLYIHTYGTSPYWVIGFRTKGEACYFLQLCGYDGHLSYGSYSRTGVGVRPAMTLDLTKCRVASGDGTRENPFTMEYTGE